MTEYFPNNYSEVTAAINAAVLLPNNDHIIWIPDLQIGSHGSTNLTTYSNLAFNGTLTDAQKGIDADIVMANTALRASVATISGGSLTLKAINKYGAKYLDSVKFSNCKGLIFDGIHFAHQNTDFTYYDLDEAQNTGIANELRPGDSSEIRTSVEVTTTSGGAHGTIIFQNCLIGANDNGVAYTHYIHGALIRYGDDVIFQDTIFDGIFRGLEDQNAGRTNLRRCTIRNRIEDGCTFYNRDTLGLYTAITYKRAEVYDLTIYKVLSVPDFAGVHSDCIQYLDANSVKGIDVQFAGIVGLAEVDRVHNASFPSDFGRFSNGIYCVDTSLFMSIGQIRNNLIVTTRNNGIVVPRGSGIVIENNTVIPGTYSNGSTSAAIEESSIGTVQAIINKNISQVYKRAGSTITPANNYVGLTATLSGGSGFFDVFAGPFSIGTYGTPIYDSIDYSTTETVQNTVDAVFLSKNAAAGFGHLISASSRPRLYPLSTLLSPSIGSMLENANPGTVVISKTAFNYIPTGISNVYPVGWLDLNGGNLVVGPVNSVLSANKVATATLEFDDGNGKKLANISINVISIYNLKNILPIDIGIAIPSSYNVNDVNVPKSILTKHCDHIILENNDKPSRWLTVSGPLISQRTYNYSGAIADKAAVGLPIKTFHTLNFPGSEATGLTLSSIPGQENYWKTVFVERANTIYSLTAGFNGYINIEIGNELRTADGSYTASKFYNAAAADSTWTATANAALNIAVLYDALIAKGITGKFTIGDFQLEDGGIGNAINSPPLSATAHPSPFTGYTAARKRTQYIDFWQQWLNYRPHRGLMRFQAHLDASIPFYLEELLFFLDELNMLRIDFSVEELNIAYDWVSYLYPQYNSVALQRRFASRFGAYVMQQIAYRVGLQNITSWTNFPQSGRPRIPTIENGDITELGQELCNYLSIIPAPQAKERGMRICGLGSLAEAQTLACFSGITNVTGKGAYGTSGTMAFDMGTYKRRLSDTSGVSNVPTTNMSRVMKFKIKTVVAGRTLFIEKDSGGSAFVSAQCIAPNNIQITLNGTNYDMGAYAAEDELAIGIDHDGTNSLRAVMNRMLGNGTFVSSAIVAKASPALTSVTTVSFPDTSGNIRLHSHQMYHDASRLISDADLQAGANPAFDVHVSPAAILAQAINPFPVAPSPGRIMTENAMHVGHAKADGSSFHQTAYVATQSTVKIGGENIIRVGDTTSCGDPAIQGSATVFVGGKAIHRQGDATGGHGLWVPNSAGPVSNKVIGG